MQRQDGRQCARHERYPDSYIVIIIIIIFTYLMYALLNDVIVIWLGLTQYNMGVVKLWGITFIVQGCNTCTIPTINWIL